MIKGQVLGGKFGEILVRQKSSTKLEIGEILIIDGEEKTLVQVTDLFYGSQISSQNLERISGLELEERQDIHLFDKNQRNYVLAKIKTLITIGESVKTSKNIPDSFSKLRTIKKEDLDFLNKSGSLILGKLRSGSSVLDVEISINSSKMLSHHVLITGTTGKGKSELMKNMIWNITQNKYASLLVFDPHDEYYGRTGVGLKDDSVYYTSKSVPAGQRTLKINLRLLRPDHFDFLDLSGPQKQALYIYYKTYGKDWISHIVRGSNVADVQEVSVAVVKRQLKLLLDLDYNTELVCDGIFDEVSGVDTIKDIVRELENVNTVIIDTSNFSGNTELLLASLITTECFNKYKYYNTKGILQEKPVINVVLEEAPRVIGKEVLQRSPNIFGSIAREGRKFKIGITALTQLPSLIPKEILANINTKIILGTEMNTERQALIESASQDLSTDNKNIASLDVGEAIITSNFIPFAIPIKIDRFNPKKNKTNTIVMGL
ncbi:MAG: ATP-binding protein [Candidatus Woesearchaeota archaeon]